MIEWIEHRHGSGATANIGHGLDLRVSYEASVRLPADEPKYNVYVFGKRLKNRSPSMSEAQARAEAAGAAWLTEMQTKFADIKGASK